ncbi:hypothetical protein EDB86DRAFT_2811903, partial [Lactarius hatsudake]
FVLYADKSNLSSFGSEKAYPVIARCVNLPTEIRNRSCGVGGGRIIPETAPDSGKTELVDSKPNVWHRAFHLRHQLHYRRSKGAAGFSAPMAPNNFLPGVIILSADYEEQCVMSLIRGIHEKMPCPICFVPDDQLADVSKPWLPRTTERMQQLIEEGKTLNKSRSRAPFL